MDLTTELDLQRATDDQLMAQLEAGWVDEPLGELQRRHGAAVQAYAMTMVRDEHLAQDVTQESFEKVFLKSHLYIARNRFRGWLLEIAHNQALTALRARRRTPRPFSSFAAPVDDDAMPFEDALGERDAEVLEERELMDAYRRAVADLPPRYRDAFQLCAEQGLQYKEAAAILGVPSGTVAIRIMRARQRLFGALARHFSRLRRPPACLQPSLGSN
ncbi:MAG: RNA polymerase sigma factor [Planctomycetota bacterium]